MFYEPSKGHGLPHDPSKAIVAPRPIGWISTVNKAGEVNLAPYSFFNAFSTRPFIVWFSSEGEKDSASFAEETGEFVANLVSRDLAEKMVRTAVDAPRGVTEFDYADLTMAPSRLVAPPRVAAAPAALECRVTEILRPKALDGTPTSAVVVAGEVVGVHIDDAFLK
ncbi:MAG: flavin reductase family protein, partial [Mesorhizobium sp.]